jgi:sporulation protein YlmC with PRC-barrel domain
MNHKISRSVLPVFISLIMATAAAWAARDRDYDYSGRAGDPAIGSESSPGSTGTMTDVQRREEVGKEVSKIEGKTGYLQCAKKFTGVEIYNPQGDKLGSVRDLVLDDSKNSVAYVLLSAHNMLHPVPWKAFVASDKYYTLDLTSEKLRQAPSIESTDIARLGSPDLKSRVDDFYSEQINKAKMIRPESGPIDKTTGWIKEKSRETFGKSETHRDTAATDTRGMAAAESKTNLYKCGDILGMNIENMEGKNIAELSDIVFDIREGNIAYGLTTFGGFVGMAKDTAAVPWSAIKIQHDRHIARLDADENTLKKAVIDRNQLQKLTEPVFARQIHQNFGQEPYWEVFGFVAPTEAGAAIASRGWGPEGEFAKSFNPAEVTTFQCTVKSVDTFTPEKDASPGLRLKVESDEGKDMVIHVGPQDYYMSQGLRFAEGDKITVTGSKARSGLRSVIVPTTIQKGDETFKIRDESGKPLWKSEGYTESKMSTEPNKPAEPNKP